ncbi:MAG: DUF4956 domain-containing protein [Balneolaceae bacterium]|nr:DUF4956 domain-containing protein [Balneolaceae bacterium]MBO6544971.1 DUF4956 domain-containing protein [Balneolaceae bacterium]MBO6646367.1 DUF4956 domain-containing protein [Balneolaceae bacterium]
MFELFPDQPVYDYPTFLNVFYSLLWSFVLSSLIAITHKLTFSGHQYPKNFFQAMALGSIVAAMVMMAIGDSLARGLGAFGALAIIRFRTRITDARNIIFLFAALSVGLAIGVFGYTIAFVGTILFCIMALILNMTPFSSKERVRGKLEFRLADKEHLKHAISVLERFCEEFKDVQIRTRATGRFDFEYSIELKPEVDNTEFLSELQNVEGIDRIRADYRAFQEEN